jgi:hypothetical protein
MLTTTDYADLKEYQLKHFKAFMDYIESEKEESNYLVYGWVEKNILKFSLGYRDFLFIADMYPLKPEQIIEYRTEEIIRDPAKYGNYITKQLDEMTSRFDLNNIEKGVCFASNNDTNREEFTIRYFQRFQRVIYTKNKA